MRASGVCAVVLSFLIQAVCWSFDAEKYVYDNRDHYNFTVDVNEAKKEILDGRGKADSSGIWGDVDLLNQILRDGLLRPPCEKVRIIVVVVPVVDQRTTFSATKCRVIGEMIERDSVRKCGRYGIDVVDANRVSASMLRTEVVIEDRIVGGRNLYVVSIKIEFTKILADPTTHLKEFGTTWEASHAEVFESDRDLEEYILLRTQFFFDGFIRREYNQCVVREAIEQLDKGGKLPAWLKAVPNVQEQKTPNERKARD